MNYLLDTNVSSELVSKKPNQRVVDWLDALPAASVFLSVVTIGEIKKGVEKLADLPRKAALERWLHDDLLLRFDGRILPLGTLEMLEWGALVARAEKSGRAVSAVDSLIAAQVVSHGGTLATRNERDFAGLGISVINPWSA